MNFSEILKDYPYTTELHAHSFPVSGCGDFSAEEVVEIYKSAGTRSLCLTNHLGPSNADLGAEYYLEDFYKAREAAGNQAGSYRQNNRK